MKKSRLLEIIREEISATLNETGLFTLKNPSDAKQGLPQTTDPDDTTEKSLDFLRKYKKVTEVELEEEQLNEIPYIGGEKGEELWTAIKTASTNLKDKFPSATPDDISKIILSKKKRPELAPEVEDALAAQEEKFGGEEKYTPNLGGPQTLRAVEKALGVKSEKSTEPKAPKELSAPKATTEPKKPAEPKAPTEPKKATLTKGDDGFDKVSYTEPKVVKAPKNIERGPSEKSLERGSGLADKKDKLVKDLNKAKSEMKDLAKGLTGLKGKEYNDLVTKLKAKTAERDSIQKQIDKL